MKTIHNITIALAFLLSLSSVKGHSQDLDYTLQSDTLNIGDDAIPSTSSLVKHGNAFTWTQYQIGNESVTVFVVNSSTGQWDAESSIGNITYALNIGGHESSLTLTGDGSGLSAQLVFDSASSQPEIYTFNITAITYQ